MLSGFCCFLNLFPICFEMTLSFFVMCHLIEGKGLENLGEREVKSLTREIRKLKSKITREEKYYNNLKSELEDTSIPDFTKTLIRPQLTVSSRLLDSLKTELDRLMSPGE